MAAAALLLLPQTPFALQSTKRRYGPNLYLRYTDKTMADTPGRLELSEEEVNSPYAKFQADPAASTGSAYVHIKCLYNNKYLRRASRSHWWIIAAADHPNENRNSWECTLFEPRLVRREGPNTVVRLLHVQLNHYLMSFSESEDLNETLYANSDKPKTKTELYTCTVIDLLLLPRTTFALQSTERRYDHNLYLRYTDKTMADTPGRLEFSEKEVNSPYAKFQADPAASTGSTYVHIKCLYNNKYLRRASPSHWWIIAAADHPNANRNSWECTLFEPRLVRREGLNTVVRLLHVQLNHYAMSFSVSEDLNETLYANSDTPETKTELDMCTVIDLLLQPWMTFALQSTERRYGHNLYLRYTDKTMADTPGRLEFSEKEVNSPYAKFQADPAASTGSTYVHIKCLYNNKYLRRASPSHWWIIAAADHPNEDRNSWECTLFEPRLVRREGLNTVVRLLHVQLNHYAMSFSVSEDLNETLYANSDTPQTNTELDMCTVIDLERIELPTTFVLKSNENGGYLRCLLDEEDSNKHEILQFSEPDSRSQFAKFKLEHPNSSEHRDRYYVHIKCLCNNKYLRRKDNNGQLILAVADQPDEDKSSWTCTLFKPEHVEPPGKNNPDKVLCRIRHCQTNLYTRPFVDSRCELELGDKDPHPEEVDAYTIMPCSLS